MTVSKEEMKMVSQMALENATVTIAGLARKIAKDCPDHVRGRDALNAFADEILATNESAWPKGVGQ